MSAFWGLAARHWPPSYPTHELVAAVGAERVGALHAAGVLRQEAIRPYGTVTCLECRRDARVIYEATGAVAICTGDFECPDQDLGPAPSRSKLDTMDFIPRLAAALGIEGQPGREGLVTQLGRRRVGDEEVAFDLCSHPGRPEAFDALAACARRGPDVRVVLVPDSRRLRADMPTEVTGAEIVWVGLDEVIRLEGRMSVDLGPVFARRAFRGLVVEPAFNGLVLDGNGAVWMGRRAIGPAQQRALQLLRALAACPGEWVQRRDLWRAVSPGEFTKGGALPRGAVPDRLDDQLRLVVKEVRAGFRAAGLERSIENQRGDEAKGGYRLALAADAVRRA